MGSNGKNYRLTLCRKCGVIKDLHQVPPLGESCRIGERLWESDKMEDTKRTRCTEAAKQGTYGLTESKRESTGPA